MRKSSLYPGFHTVTNSTPIHRYDSRKTLFFLNKDSIQYYTGNLKQNQAFFLLQDMNFMLGNCKTPFYNWFHRTDAVRWLPLVALKVSFLAGIPARHKTLNVLCHNDAFIDILPYRQYKIVLLQSPKYEFYVFTKTSVVFFIILWYTIRIQSLHTPIFGSAISQST